MRVVDRLVITGNSDRGHINLVPMAEPSGANSGGVYMGTDGVLRVHTGDGWEQLASPTSLATPGSDARAAVAAVVTADRQAFDHQINASDYAIYPDATTDSLPGLEEAFIAAGFNVGAAYGSLASASAAVELPPSPLNLDDPLTLTNTWNFHIRGTPGKSVLRGNGDLDALLALDGVGYGVVEGLSFNYPSNNNLYQDVLKANRTASAGASVHMLRLRDIAVQDVEYVRGISLGRESANLDMAQTYLNHIIVQGGESWTAGNTTTKQEGIHFGSNTNGNVLNFTLSDATIGGVRYGVYIDATNVVMRNVFFDTGEYALTGSGRSYVALDGFRVEDFQGFCKFSGSDGSKRHYVFRNGWYAHNLTTTNQAAFFERAGDILFENVSWQNPNYVSGTDSTYARIVTGGNHGRRITLRNFTARELPEELWWYTSGSGNDRRGTYIVLDGYTQVDASSNSLQAWTGSYRRTVSNSTTAEYRHILPMDHIVIVTRTSDTSMELPFAKWMQGRELIVKSETTNLVTLTAQSGETVDSGADTTLTSSGQSVHLIASGTDWMVL